MTRGSDVPRFSIILPTHNRCDVLPFAIRSALRQTVDDFELVVAGDGCTDDTAEVVASFNDRRVRWLDLPKAPGVGYANRNVALRASEGELIAYLAHDDLWFPDHLERLGSLLDATGADFVYSRGLSVRIDGRIIPYWFNLEVDEHRRASWRGDAAIAMSSVVHRRECLARWGYWDETLHRGADKVMWQRILAGGGFSSFAFLPTPTMVRFVADWRFARERARARRLTRWFANGLLDDVLPAAMRLRVPAGESPQQAMLRHLNVDSGRPVGELRAAVTQLQDAILWRGTGTLPRMVGLRVGLGVGAWLERLRWRAASIRPRSDRRVRQRWRESIRSVPRRAHNDAEQRR